jgi:hypothetical protein
MQPNTQLPHSSNAACPTVVRVAALADGVVVVDDAYGGVRVKYQARPACPSVHRVPLPGGLGAGSLRTPTPGSYRPDLARSLSNLTV